MQYRFRMAHSRRLGFTMIELVAVIAILAVVAVIAYPSYQEQVRKTRRSQAMEKLVDVSLLMEKFRSNNPTYAADVVTLCDWIDDGNGANTSCADADIYDTEYYDVTIAGAANTYTLTADPQSTQTSDTDCDPMTLNQNGNRAPDSCW